MVHADPKQDSKMALYLKNVTYIDWQNFEITQGNLRISESVNGDIEFIDTIPEDSYNCQGKLLTKSFACGHHHAYSALARGMPAPSKQPNNFKEILEYIWWNLDKKLDADSIRASALVTAINCAKNGVTFVIDHHASPFAIKGSLNLIAEAFEKIGINHLLCYEMSDRDGSKIRQQGLDETEAYLQNHQGLVGLHASFTVGDDLLKFAITLAQKYSSGIHIHIAEDGVDQELCQKNHQMRVIERLSQAGALDYEKTILAHCIHLDENERRLLKDSKAWIAVNTESNLNNHVGLFSNDGDLEDKVILGTDGMHSDMIRSAQINFFIHKDNDHLSFMDSYQRFRRAHHYIHSNGFSGDSANNLVIFDYKSPTPVTADNWLGHFFYGLNSSDVDSVIANGKWVLKEKKLLNIDEEKILRFAKDQAVKLWEKL